MSDPDQTEEDLMTDLYKEINYQGDETSGHASKLQLGAMLAVIKTEFGIDINRSEMVNMFKILGSRNGKVSMAELIYGRWVVLYARSFLSFNISYFCIISTLYFIIYINLVIIKILLQMAFEFLK